MQQENQLVNVCVQKVLADNFVSSPPLDIVSLARNYALTATAADLSEKGIVGFIDVDSETVVIDKDQSDQKKAFYIAYALGLWLLHKENLFDDPDKYGIFEHKPLGADLDNVQQEATLFAAMVLVPASLLKNFKDTVDKDLAKIFGVPEEVIGFLRFHKKLSL